MPERTGRRTRLDDDDGLNSRERIPVKRNSRENAIFYGDSELQQLREDLAIQPDYLDECHITHAHDFYHVTEGHAHAIANRDGLKFDLDQLYARIEKEVREDAAADGMKTTEAAVAAAVKTDASYVTAYKRWLDACLLADRWRGLLDAWRERGKMLSLMESHAWLNRRDGQPPEAAAIARKRFERRRGEEE